MRMIPDRVVESTSSRAEVRVFDYVSLLDDGDWFYGLHSLNLTEHEWKRVAEIDFVLVGRSGIFAIEVKGGHLSCTDGVWFMQDRAGRRRRRQNPFAQVRSAVFSLQKTLTERLPELEKVTFGSAVVLPDCDLEVSGVEWAPQEVIDRGKLSGPGGFAAGIDALVRYWREKPGRRTGPVDRHLAERLLTELRPDYDPLRTLRQVASAADDELARLTTGQYRALDAYPRNPRVLYEGGAGTGKTLLAVEMARRHASLGRSVLFTCRSQILAGFVRAQPGTEDITVAAFPRLRQDDGRRYDMMIVDEAQDVLNLDDLELISSRLTGGLNDGNWCFFLDSNNQQGLVGSYDEQAMRYLLQTVRPAVVSLVDNCRNTRQIVTHTQRTTGADIGVSTAGVGPDVVVRQVDSLQEAAAAAAAYLAELERQGVPTADVVLLSPAPFADSTFGGMPRGWSRRVEVLDMRRLHQRSGGLVGFARTADFKGLESRFVLLDHMDFDDSAEARRHLYVGMTRARIGLWIVARALPEVGTAGAPSVRYRKG